MKSIIDRIFSARTLALLLALCATTSAWAAAPTPTVVWRNNLGESYTSGGNKYGIELESGAGSVNSSGNITMSTSYYKKGATIDLSGISNLKKASVLVKYSSLATPSYLVGLATVKDVEGHVAGMCAVASATKLNVHKASSSSSAANNWNFTPTNPDIITGEGYFLLAYDASTGLRGYMGSAINSLSGGLGGGTTWSGEAITQISLGGSCTTDHLDVWPNLVIEEVALFVDQYLSNTDVADFDFNAPPPAMTPPTPIAIFNGFSTSIPKSGDYTLTRNDNTINADGSISIAKGIKLEATSGMSYNSSAGYTIAVKYSNMPASTSGAFVSTDLTALPNNANGIGLWHTGDGKTRGLWTDAEWTGANQTQYAFPNSGVATYSVGYNDKPQKANAFDKNGNIIYAATGLFTSTESTGGKKIYVGSLFNGGAYNTSVLSNLKVEGVAVFNKRLSDSEVIAFNTKVFAKIISANATWSTITSANFNGDGLPTNDAWADVTINVTENATLTLDSAVNVGKITFNVLPNKTLTLSGAYSITASDGIYVKGGGTLDKGNAALSSAMTISDENTTVISTSMPSANVSIGVGSTYTLKDTKWTGNNNYFSGEGTLYLDTRSGFSSNRITHDVSGATFSGTLKIGVPQANPAYFNGDPETQLTGWPTLRLECGTEDNQGQLWVGGSAVNKKFQVKNLSGWAKVVPWSNKEGNHYFVTQQEEDTTFSGNFVDWSGSQIGAGKYKTALTVKGGSSVKSLSLTAANETSGPLEVQNNGKVIFSGSGSWNNGTTTVKQGGVIESQRNAQVVGSVTFESGAKIAINGSNYFQAGAITTPASGTVTLDVSNITALPTGTSAATVLKTTTTNLDIDNKFALAGANANYYLAQNTTSGDVTIQMYAAKDSNDVYYKTASAAFDAIVADHSLTVTILDGTEASHDSELAEKTLVRPNSGTLVKFPAAVIKSGETLTPYETVQEAFSALQDMAYSDYRVFNYIAVYESATVQYYSALNAPKVKIEGDEVSLTINFPENYGDYWWTPISVSESGVTSYNYGSKPTTYTWDGSENANWSATTSWKYDATHNANRELNSEDNAIFGDGAVVTIDKNGVASSITISGDVTFTATSAKTITVGDGGVVLSALGDSLTLSNVTLSKVPTTTAVTLAVQTTGGGEDPTVYTVVNSVASVDGVGYATIAEASEALKTGSIMTLQQDYDGTVTIYPGKYLVKNGHTATLVVGATVDGDSDPGIVVTENTQGGFWQCVDQRTATWQGNSAYWSVANNWVEKFAPTAYTAVTIPATEGHATSITLSGDVTIKSLALGAGETLTLSRSGETARTVTTSEAIVLTSGQSIVTNPGVTISPAITTEDANSYVKSVTSDGATTYTVAVHKATVYDAEDAEVKKYDSLADAFAAATDGQKITLFADSNVAIALNGKSITFNESSYTFTGSFSGSGTLTLSALLKSADAARWAEGWTGTVVLPENADVSGCNFDNYGIEGSVVRLTGATTATWLRFSNNNSNPVAPAIEIPEGASFTLASEGFSSSFAYTFNVLKGAGSFTVNISGNIDRSESGYSAYFLLKDVSNFTGSLSASGAGIAIGDTRISNSVAGGKIIVSAGKSATIAFGATWQTASGFSVNGALTCSKGGKIYGTGAAGTLALGGSGVITNKCEGATSQCFNAGTITVSDSLSVVMVGGWSNFGTSWNPQNSSSIGFDPGSDNDIWLNSTIPNNSNANCTLCIYGNGSNKVVWNGSITPWAKIHVYNGGKLQIGTTTGTSDYLGYASIGALGAVTVDAGGELYFYTRETYTRHTYLNGGTITFAGDQSSRSFDIFRGPTVYVTDDSVMQATGSGHWVYLRDTAPTFNVDANKTLTFNASFTYAGESNKDLIKVGAGTMVVNGYVDGSGNHEPFSQPKGVDIQAGTYELNARQTSNGQTGANANFYTVASGAKLKVGATGQVNTATLTLNNGSMLEFGAGDTTLINASTVTFASGTTSVSFSSGVTPTDGATLIDWTSAPDGVFAFANSELAADWRLVKDGEGLKIAAIEKINNTSSVEAGYIDASGAAVITNTISAVTIPADATSVDLSFSTGSEITLTSTVLDLATSGVTVYATDANGVKTATDISSAFKVTAGENYTYTVELDEEKVAPEVKGATPMAFTSTAPTFAIEAVPGLWYAVEVADTIAGLENPSYGTPVQAESATVNPVAPAFTGTVKYYRIGVAPSRAALQ